MNMKKEHKAEEYKKWLDTEADKVCSHGQNLKKIYNRISFARLGTFLIFLLGILMAYALKNWYMLFVAFAGGAGFVILLVKHNSIAYGQDYYERRGRVIRQMKMRADGKWSESGDTGAEFFDANDYVAKDLDLLGSHSLYQMLCVAHTELGRKKLAEVLKMAGKAEISADTIRKRQCLVKELAEHREFRIHYEALALEQGKEETDKKKTKNKDSEQLEPVSDEAGLPDKNWLPVLSVIATLLPVLMLVCFVGAVLHIWNMAWILILFFGGLLFSWIIGGYCDKYTGEMFYNQRTLRSNVLLMEAFLQEEFHDDNLIDMQKLIMNKDAVNAVDGMKQLERLLAVYNLRHNPIVHWLLSGIFLYDVHLARLADAWKRKYAQSIEDCMQILSDIEMLNSLAVLAEIRDCTFPVILDKEDDLQIIIKEGCHPLISYEKAVANSVELCSKTQVVTGSNMSGKTTFLRMIGVNVILAYSGAPVCAEDMQLSIMRTYTSMRVSDDVNHGISTFYAEILRIKEMVEYGAKGKPMLCLIDEIFKGTNSADRIVGAEAVIKKLMKKHIIALVSTHDFELCRLADNYHFEEYYDEDGIKFDYQLKSGPCKTTNALHLLKLAGITEE